MDTDRWDRIEAASHAARGLERRVLTGHSVGTYEVLEPIGSGGMGEVYRARDKTLKRDVALKVLPAHLVLDSDRLARFRREAQVLASLNHPNIAIIHGFEQSDGVQALVLELVEGPTLAERIADGPIAIDEALPIVRQIAAALEAAHEQGIVHRDLKPANIKIRPDGTVKVLDFGLAKALEPTSSIDGAPTASPTITSPAVTRAGLLLGTAAYMSPEQAKGHPVDKRSDVWAFGCVIYEMITGRLAFGGDDISDTLAGILRGEPDWNALPRVSRDGKQIALRVGDDKEGDIWIYDLAGTSAMRRLTFGGKDRYPVWSSDGQRIVFQSEREGDGGIFWQRADFSGTAERLTRPNPGTSHIPESWSPQGDVFTYSVLSERTRRYSLASFSIQTKQSGPVGDATSTLPLASDFSPDGRWLAYDVSDRLLGPAEATVFVEPFPPTGTKYQISQTRNGFHPTWLPDGKSLTHSTGVGPNGPQWVVVNITMQPQFAVGNAASVPNGGLIDTLGPGLYFPGSGLERNYDFTPDGKRVGIVPVRDEASPVAPIANTRHIQVVLNWQEELKQRVPTR